MQIDLEDRVAIVTGASRGIGKAIAAAYAAAGASVVIASRKQEGLDETAAEIAADGGKVLPIATHVGDEQAVNALVQQTIDTFGRVDIAVSNAGTNPHFGSMLSATAALWDKILEVNLRGAFLLCKAVAPHMEAAGGGRIVIMSSVAGLRPSKGLGIYSVSKAGLNMLTQVLAAELGPSKIRVNAIAPGTIKTRFSKVLYETKEIAERLIGQTPLGFLGEPEDVVGAALYLGSSLSDYVNGAILTVDGGVTVAGGLG
jgi:NAD(P)-dependent dehydrogenase (short-subunit alcohol dehydrogenase family)